MMEVFESDILDAMRFTEQMVGPKSAAEALALAWRYGGIDGEHHKAWVIDQMVRALTGPKYEDFVKDACAGEDGPQTYTWETGIAP